LTGVDLSKMDKIQIDYHLIVRRLTYYLSIGKAFNSSLFAITFTKEQNPTVELIMKVHAWSSYTNYV